MIKIVGKIVLLIGLLLHGYVYTQELALQITDMRDVPITSIEVGTPFKIKISVHGFSIQGKELVIQGLEQVMLDAHQEQISIINGVRSCMHTYCARIDKLGTYTIGPARASYQGQEIISPLVSLTVTKPKTNNTPKKEAYFARLTCEKNEIFLGEKVYCHIHFYAKDPDSRFTNLLAPTFAAKVENTQYQGPFESLETVHGTEYVCRHVQWICYPKAVGQMVIPAYTVVYTVPSDDRVNFGGFSAFFGMRPVQQVLYTNAASLHVRPLPPYTGSGTVQAIGSYERFELMVKQPTVPVGQAVEVVLQLTGSGDLEGIATPELQGLPASCKQYASQVTTTPGQNNRTVKTFEYIVQATVPGALKIPEQQFIFFDTHSASYKTLTTKAQEVTVMPAPAPPASVQANQLSDAAQRSAITQTTHNGSLDKDSCPIIRDAYYAQPYWHMPWWFFMLLFWLVPLGIFFVLVYRACMILYDARSDAKKSERAFVYARACLQKAEEKQEYTHLYEIFTRLFSVRVHNRQIPIDQAVRAALLHAGFSQQVCDEWQQFFADCAAFVFLANTPHADPLMFKQAHYWLGILEQAL